MSTKKFRQLFDAFIASNPFNRGDSLCDSPFDFMLLLAVLEVEEIGVTDTAGVYFTSVRKNDN